MRFAVETHRMAFSAEEANRLRWFGFAFDETSIAKSKVSYLPVGTEVKNMHRRLDVPASVNLLHVEDLWKMACEFGPLEVHVCEHTGPTIVLLR